MTDWFNAVLGFVLRLGLLLAGLVFVATILMLAGLMLVLWMVRALWATLTGKPVSPWKFEVHRMRDWQRFYRGSRKTDNTHETDGSSSARDRQQADVVDVEIKRLDERDRHH